MNLEPIYYQELAKLTYEVLQGIIFGILLALIFTFNRQGQVRLTLADGFTPPIKTSIIAVSFIIILIAWHFINEVIEAPVTKYLHVLDYRLIPASIALFSFSGFWLTKVTLGRKWKNHTTILLLLISVGFAIIFYVLLYYSPPTVNN